MPEPGDTQTQDGARDPFTEGAVREAPGDGGDGALVVDVAGFEGPLDLLLAMARTQKVDLSRISILALAEQYLSFITELRKMRLEVAADYLVMAAWLAYLKSRLLLPEPPEGEDELSGEEMAAHLAFRLRRLEAMRKAAARLMTRNRLGRDVFSRGTPEGIRVERRNEYTAELYDLLKAYSQQREKTLHVNYRIRPRPVVTLKEARETLARLVGAFNDWGRMDECLAEYVLGHVSRASAIASTFGASLDLARDGEIEIRQEHAYAPVYVRRKGPRLVN